MTTLDALLDRGRRALVGATVPDPAVVAYGVTPWTPARDVTYTQQNPDGSWQPPRAGVVRKARPVDAVPYHPDHKVRCGHCRDEPFAAGDLCPACHRDSRPGVEDRLALQRARSARWREAEVPLERQDAPASPKAPRRPKAPTPAAVLAQATLPVGVLAEATKVTRGAFTVVLMTEDRAHFTAARFPAERLHDATNLIDDLGALGRTFVAAVDRPRMAQEVPCSRA